VSRPGKKKEWAVVEAASRNNVVLADRCVEPGCVGMKPTWTYKSGRPRNRCVEHWNANLRETKRRWRENKGSSPENKNKNLARSAARRAHPRTPLTACSSCGTREGKLERDHHKGYERQFWTDIRWLCTACHMRLDRWAR
jgi:hypothetical protein